MCQFTDYNCHFISSPWQHNKKKNETRRNFRRKATKNVKLVIVLCMTICFMCVRLFLAICFFICSNEERDRGEKGNIHYRCISWTHTQTQHKMGHQTKFKTYIKLNKHFQEIKTKKRKNTYDTQCTYKWIFRDRDTHRERHYIIQSTKIQRNTPIKQEQKAI